jgi:hypothetical protein
MPLAMFDARSRKTYRLPRPKGPQQTDSVSGAAAPETEKQEQQQNLPNREKVSGMCPV